jgi:hypothetical protein
MAASKPDHGHDMFRLVYASRAVLPVLAKFEATVQDILRVSQANNARVGVTGLLIAHKGWFIQALEGPRRNVSMVFGTIGRDLRHAQLEVMVGGPVEARLFGGWSMCAHAIAPSAAAILKTLDLTPDFDPFTMDGDRMLRLMQAVSMADPAPEPEFRKVG